MLKGQYTKGKYPPGWADLYDRWKRGEITNHEFFVTAGLKPAHFYYALADWVAEHR